MRGRSLIVYSLSCHAQGPTMNTIFVKMLVFLDIDGVMAPAKSWQRPDILEDGFVDFSVFL